MAIPSSYTELSLAAFMVTVTRSVTGALDWSADDFGEAVNDTLLAYGVTAVASATDIAKLRALARVEAWRTVVDGTAADIDFAADGGDYKRSQMHSQARAALERALEQAAPYLPTTEVDEGFSVEMGSLVFADSYVREL